VIYKTLATSHCSLSCVSHEVLAVIAGVMIYGTATTSVFVTKSFAELFVQPNSYILK